ncbi:hypothetical protein B0H17DRAFT_1127279 [Mycena rosella]|uniref:MYND-type domain-containing protein n=1 Tax=Mycena rosella TaxID=1033263 RepID=A0AAD7GRI2_MYCRO|nr:hypothetical protein B0H17DRAFT_1127279 [Mycena rosella]
MHPSLHLGNLTNLPSHLRSAARTACLDTDRSIDELSRLHNYLSAASAGQKQARCDDHLLLLPVPYTVLDQVNICRESILRGGTTFEGPYALRAGVALNLLLVIAQATRIPADAVPDLWERIWQWIRYRCDYLDVPRDSKEVVVGFALATLHVALIHKLVFAARAADGPENIVDTSDLRFVLVRAWECLVQDPRPQRPSTDCLFKVMALLMGTSDPHHLDEMIRGAGGDSSHAAKLVIAQLAVFASDIYSDPWGQHHFLAFLIAIFRHHIGRDCPNVEKMLGEILRYVQYYSVLGRIDTALTECSDGELLHDLGSSAMWSEFLRLVEDKVAVKREFETQYNSIKFCDDMEFRRCSHCQSAYYCSTGCQTADWVAGDNRHLCKSLRFESRVQDISMRGKAFLRYLVHDTYLKNKALALELRKDFMMTSPGPFYTMFEFTGGDVGVEVLPPEHLRSLLGPDMADGYLAHMAKSGGRMQLDVVMGAQGGIMYPSIFPMRSDSSKLHQGLLEIAGRAQARELSLAEQEEG